jgi:hypothetical protein
MSSIEEKLWEYIDGTCTAAEREAVEKLIADNDIYRQKYEELLAFNKAISADIELDEPTMAFTYNVMDAIRTDYAIQHPLKTRVNKTLIWVICGLFTVILLLAFVIFLTSLNWQTDVNMHANDLHFMIFKGGDVWQAFLFFDTILLLFVLNRFLRNRISHQQS